MTTENSAAADTTPQIAEVKIGDKTFKVSADAAAAISAATAAADAQLTGLKSDVAQLKAAVTAATTPREQPAERQENEVNYDEIFTNPKAFFEKHDARVRAAVTAELTGQYRQNEGTKEFWAEFYKANPALKAHDLVVKAVMERDFALLKDLKISEASVKLADAAKTYLVTAGVKLPPNPTAPAAEGGSGNLPSATESKTNETESEGSLTETPPNSLSGIILQRRQARRGQPAKRA